MRFFAPTMAELLTYMEEIGGTIEDYRKILPYAIDTAQKDTVWLIPEFPTNTEHEPLHEPTLREKKLIKKLNDIHSPLSLHKHSFTEKQHYTLTENKLFTINSKLRTILLGRLLLLDELPFSLHEIHAHVSQGMITYEQGVVYEDYRYSCKRCGNNKQSMFATFSCYRCKDECTYCRSCIMMGRVTTCTPLLRWTEKIEEETRTIHTLQWHGTLSFFQKKASSKLTDIISAMKENTETLHAECLIWAVCGAGKTEMLFEGIQLALNSGLKIAVATPRTDVVLELEPRFKEAFPETHIHAFYGGADDKYAQAEFVISTTHQLLRFYKAFNIVIIDEVDAFPYSYDEKLRYAVAKAKKDDSLTVYVTATPEKKMKERAELGILPCMKVARRYHRYPLPVPHYLWVGNWEKKLKKNALPFQVVLWINEKMSLGKQVFLFVPTVKVMKQVVDCLSRYIQVEVEGVHASDECRREKVLKFRKGDIKVLVTTTILERGVTVKGVQVAVLGADDRIFTESALVQISGRVGRSPDEPGGDVVFFHHGKTNAMVEARKHIVRMNKLGEAELQ
ncbi:DEAD/DEAH box helicase [Evansella cellulosilytica]|uniref:Helicase domain protein n=1 Tax=Evansella cellulosilytica (strain ATCC 21833 / DSM 2522 / FERM P-1141 / JCM 9156 / N-4) TaxID=649639 RepID=E6TSA2_EVAC2|nr:DEAD/DEAH box helicase [Evansella cellulosilytica]ADU31871.1 helicase domain protein [Evansella cellulosilytica DSM 2522]